MIVSGEVKDRARCPDPAAARLEPDGTPGKAPPERRRPVHPRVVRSPTMETSGLLAIAAGSGEIARDGRAADDGASVRTEPNAPSDLSGPATRFNGPERPVPPANSGQPDRTTRSFAASFRPAKRRFSARKFPLLKIAVSPVQVRVSPSVLADAVRDGRRVRPHGWSLGRSATRAGAIQNATVSRPCRK